MNINTLKPRYNHQDHGSVEDVVGFKKKKTIATKVILETKTKFF